MSSLAIFVGGMLTGAALTFITLVFAAKKAKKKHTDKEFEESEKEVVSDIMQDYAADTDKYVISPEIYGNGEYDTESLTMWRDGVLTYSYNKNEVLNADELIGVSNLAHVGEYEDNLLCIRNEETQTDYEIEFVQAPWKDG